MLNQWADSFKALTGKVMFSVGKVSKKLAQRFRKATRQRVSLEATQLAEALPDIQELLGSGYDPLHAAYVQTQNLMSVFAESVSTSKELSEYAKIAGDAEDEYMPGGPPMSPLTTSYFTTWAFFDLRFGPDKETIGTCLLELADVPGFDELQVEPIRNYQESRMGIYEHSGRRKSRIRLKELLTGKEFVCHSTSGYQGKKGELWYVRLGPPISSLEDLADYHVTLTTPYILMNASKIDWTAYLKKNLSAAVDTDEALNDFLKYGPTPCHWHEFVLLSYHHAQYDAIFLTGLPDVKGSLPHAN